MIEETDERGDHGLGSEPDVVFLESCCQALKLFVSILHICICLSVIFLSCFCVLSLCRGISHFLQFYVMNWERLGLPGEVGI